MQGKRNAKRAVIEGLQNGDGSFLILIINLDEEMKILHRGFKYFRIFAVKMQKASTIDNKLIYI